MDGIASVNLHFYISFGLQVGQFVVSVASTAVSLGKVAVIGSGEVGKCAVCSRYNNGTMTPLGCAAIDWESCMYSVGTFTMKCLLCK
jgi:hypothetical protein